MSLRAWRGLGGSNLCLFWLIVPPRSHILPVFGWDQVGSWFCSSATCNRNRMSSDTLTIRGQFPRVSPSWEWREGKSIAASSQRSAPTNRQPLPFSLLSPLCVDRLEWAGDYSADSSGMPYGKPFCGTSLEPLVMPGGCSFRWWHQDAGKCPNTLTSHIPSQAHPGLYLEAYLFFFFLLPKYFSWGVQYTFVDGIALLSFGFYELPYALLPCTLLSWPPSVGVTSFAILFTFSPVP